MRRKPLYLIDTALTTPNGAESSRSANWLGTKFPAGGPDSTGSTADYSFLVAVQELPGVKRATYRTKVTCRNMGTLADRSSDGTRVRRARPIGSDRGDGACVVVRTRESRVHGEGRQGTDGAGDDGGTIRGHG
jgi:hypothetical protein